MRSAAAPARSTAVRIPGARRIWKLRGTIVGPTRRQSAAPPQPAPPVPDQQGIFLGRQPILDTHGHLQAFELLFRSGLGNEAKVSSNLAATARVLHYVFAELGVERALGPYRGFINCDESLLLEPGLLEAMPADKLVLEILETVAPDPAVLQRCQELKGAGFQLALDDYTGGAASADFLPLVDIVKVDVLSTPDGTLEKVVRGLSKYTVTLLAEKVQTREEADACRALGFELFQGYYFARPTVIQGHRLRQSQLAVLRVLALLMKNADPLDLEQVFKQEPALSLNLLRIVNSVGTGLRSPVTSLAHGITIVGQRPLLRWMQLLLYAEGAGQNAGNPLLHLAATRGRLMELLARDLWPGQAERGDAAFMAGMMSLVPALLHAPIAEILAPLPLPPDVSDALLHHQGGLGPLLQFVEGLESMPAPPPIAGLTADQVSRRLAEAMTWTHEVTGTQH